MNVKNFFRHVALYAALLFPHSTGANDNLAQGVFNDRAPKVETVVATGALATPQDFT